MGYPLNTNLSPHPLSSIVPLSGHYVAHKGPIMVLENLFWLVIRYFFLPFRALAKKNAFEVADCLAGFIRYGF